jgi:hypothetical protein
MSYSLAYIILFNVFSTFSSEFALDVHIFRVILLINHHFTIGTKYKWQNHNFPFHLIVVCGRLREVGSERVGSPPQ